MEVKLKRKADEREYWRYYFHLFNASKNLLTDREIDLMVEVMSADPYKSIFRGVEREQTMKALNIKNTPYLSKLKKGLVNKGLIQETGILKGDLLPITSLRDFQFKVKKAIEEKGIINLKLEFTFKDEV